MASRGSFKIDLLPFAALNAGANLAGRPPLARHAIRIEAFFRAGAAFRAVQTFKTATKARVPQLPITAAIARKLVQDAGNPGCILIDLHLPSQLEIDPGQFFAVQNRRQYCIARRRRRMECRNVSRWIGPLCVSHNADQGNCKGPPETLSTYPLKVCAKVAGNREAMRSARRQAAG